MIAGLHFNDSGAGQALLSGSAGQCGYRQDSSDAGWVGVKNFNQLLMMQGGCGH